MARKPVRATGPVRARAKELRRTSTPAEQALWERLRGRRLDGLKFRRQHPVGRSIADFYCAEAMLVVEVDGGIHKAQQASDAERTALLESRGYRVIRFPNERVMHDIEGVLREIRAAAGGEPSPSPGAQAHPAPPSPTSGEGGAERQTSD